MAFLFILYLEPMIIYKTPKSAEFSTQTL